MNLSVCKLFFEEATNVGYNHITLRLESICMIIELQHVGHNDDSTQCKHSNY